MRVCPQRCTSTSLVEWIRWAGAVGGGGAAHAEELARALGSRGAPLQRLAAALRADLAARRPYAAYLASCRAAAAHQDLALDKYVHVHVFKELTLRDTFSYFFTPLRFSVITRNRDLLIPF